MKETKIIDGHMGDTLMANNMKYTDDAEHPLDIYYVIK
jgi:hypothetical protein